MKTKKSKLYIITLLIALFNISCFSVYPESHAKYIKEETDKLVYDATLYKLKGNYKTIGIDKSHSSSTLGYFNVLFDRNTLMYDNNNTDSYTITIGSNNTSDSNLCRILSINSNGSSSRVSDSVYNVTYSDNTADTVFVNVVCDMDEDYYLTNPSDHINLSLTVTEQMDSENEFTYISTSYVLTTYKEYYDIYGSLYNRALYHVQNAYADDTSMQQVAVYYFNSVFETDSDIETKTLDGFNYDSTTGTFSLDSNFLKYARTYYNTTTNVNGKYYFYFDSTDNDRTSLENLFNYYLNIYANYSEEDYNELMTYINSKTNGIIDALNARTIGFATATDSNYNLKILVFDDSIIDTAKEANHPTTINVATITHDRAIRMKSSLRTAIDNYAGLSDTVKTGLKSRLSESTNDFITLLTTNAVVSGTSPNTEFSGVYFDSFGEDENIEKIMANVYSNGDGTTNVKFYNLVEGNTVNYTSPTEITESDYNQFVDDVHEYVYGEEETDEKELETVTPDEDGFYVYDYTIEE